MDKTDEGPNEHDECIMTHKVNEMGKQLGQKNRLQTDKTFGGIKIRRYTETAKNF